MSRNQMGSTVGWLGRLVVPACAALAVLTVAVANATAGAAPTAVPELGSGAAVTALAVVAGASLIFANRRSSE